MTAESVPNPTIHCSGVTVQFPTQSGRPQTVLNGLDLTIPTGSVTTLLGPSGCGKSTLLRVIAGLIQPIAGEVSIDQRSLRTDGKKLREMMSFVFQESALLPWRTVLQNVMLPAELRCLGRNKATLEQAYHWLEIVGLSKSDWTKRPNQLSGGMKMRASIARAMTTLPKILLMDEPFAALDDVLRSKLNDLMLKIAEEQQCTVVFVTHNISEAIYISDTIAVMSEGKIARKMPIHFDEPRLPKLRSTEPFARTYGNVSDILFQAVS